ncbi:hypothetical protein Ppro_0552 [Pelobacter propionicus DSM 2379]|uniref:Uncharacterized protein n=2 Tax=Pelobacter propionicus TaxID=29543 RepID=A1ALG3_PELPD|nr:hypothetical protein Ppro_0552 [Pelobacter propionicus DSM 2379]
MVVHIPLNTRKFSQMMSALNSLLSRSFVSRLTILKIEKVKSPLGETSAEIGGGSGKMEMQAGSRAAEQDASLVAGWMSDENIVGRDDLHRENTDDGAAGQSERQSVVVSSRWYCRRIRLEAAALAA